MSDSTRLLQSSQATLRRQALDWLHAEPAAWTKILASGPTEEKGVIVQTLKQWQKDADLAGIRDGKALAKRPEAERAALK